jgi:nucleoid-associated protein YgaU
MYRVGSDDTLTGISQRHLGRASRWSEIFELNQAVMKTPDRMRPGLVLQLPGDASRLSEAPGNVSRQ